eukprot:8774749-Alexandrium_andersonii.AAC.1
MCIRDRCEAVEDPIPKKCRPAEKPAAVRRAVKKLDSPEAQATAGDTQSMQNDKRSQAKKLLQELGEETMAGMLDEGSSEAESVEGLAGLREAD